MVGGLWWVRGWKVASPLKLPTLVSLPDCLLCMMFKMQILSARNSINCYHLLCSFNPTNCHLDK